MPFEKIKEYKPSLLLEDLLPLSIPMTIPKGNFIYQQGDNPQGLYYVRNGIVGLKHTTPSGKEHLLRFFRNSDYFGHRALFSQESYHATSLTLEPSDLYFFPRQDILSLFEKKTHLYKSFALILADELKRCETQRVLIIENQILARTAQAIIFLKELYPLHKWTRQEIADFVASTPTTIIKALAALENRNLIIQKGREILIQDREGLLSIPDDEVF